MRDSRLNARIVLPARPIAVGDKVKVWGKSCAVIETAWSHAVDDRIVTVEFSNRIRLRVRASIVEREGQQ